MSIIVVAANPPILANAGTKSFTATVAIEAFNFTNTGAAVTSCAISPALPAGFSFNTSTCEISGTPCGTSSATYTVTATAADTTTDTATVTINVAAANPPILADQGSKNFVTTVEISSFDFANTGDAIVSCSISPSLSSGLAFSTSTCAISGTPTVAKAATTYTVTAIAADGSSDTATVAITVVAANPPVFTPGGSQNLVTTLAHSFDFLRTGGDATSCFSSPSLPSGLSVAANLGTCRISGTPNTPQASESYTITATADDESQSTTTITLAISAANPPIVADISPAIELTKDEEIDDIIFNNTGASITNCEISPSLPAGLDLSFNTTSCTTSGTPTVSQGTTEYTITATAADGSKDTATVSLSISLGVLVCPTGYIPVPECTDDDTGTVPAFCVMKYEAKNDGLDNAVSQATGYPWVSISRNAAIAACQSLSTPAHYNFDLITNAQWQSIARQIERYESSPGVLVNWENNSNSDPNSLNFGNSGNGSPLAADAIDTNGCSGTSFPSNCNNTWHLNKRTHSLPNEEVIWDLAGNVAEWVKDNSTFNYGYNNRTSLLTSSSGDACASPACSGPQGKPKAAFGPYGDHTEKSSTPYGGLGYSVLNAASGAIIRGNNFNASDLSGVFATYVNYAPTFSDTSFGFRCTATPSE